MADPGRAPRSASRQKSAGFSADSGHDPLDWCGSVSGCPTDQAVRDILSTSIPSGTGGSGSRSRNNTASHVARLPVNAALWWSLASRLVATEILACPTGRKLHGVLTSTVGEAPQVTTGPPNWLCVCSPILATTQCGVQIGRPCLGPTCPDPPALTPSDPLPSDPSAIYFGPLQLWPTTLARSNSN